jgi:dimethylargininase
VRLAAVRFTRALVRPPADTFADGITSSGLGSPDPALARAQHEAYCRALERLGLSLERLPPDPAFPDSPFVEDTAIVARDAAILTRPGAPSRAGEVASVGEALGRWFPEPARIIPPGTLDGGDVCDTDTHVFIGRSARTNAEGAVQLATWLSAQGLGSTVIDIRSMPALLHLKTGISWLGGRRLLVSEDLERHEAFSGWDLMRVPAGEEYAANCIRVNDTILVPEGLPSTRKLLERLSETVIALDMSEYRKMDGGLSCLSVRW